MIAFLHGKIIDKTSRTLIIDVNGVGYSVSTPESVLQNAEIHLPMDLHIYTNVREDEISLYGFEKREDLDFFKQLISVNGVGPRVALDLFTSPIEHIKQAILEGNITVLTQMKGIGKKTAERIILELKEKIYLQGYEGNSPALVSNSKIPDEVLEALLGLGYKQKDISRVFRSLKNSTEDSETLIKYFLKHV